MSEFKLIKEILDRSNSKIWDTAKQEWKVWDIYESSNGTCLCGHYPITEHCVLLNKLNKSEVVVGNCCVNKFLHSNKLFETVRKVKKDILNSFNADFITLCYEKGYIDDWQYNFYTDTWRKRLLTEKQMKQRVKINKQILEKFMKKTEDIRKWVNEL